MRIPDPTKFADNIWAYSKKGLTRAEWLVLRRALGLGGSDIGTIAGLNEWQDCISLFYEKCGVWGDWTNVGEFNLRTYSGHILEKVVYNDYWRYYNPEDPTKEAFLENINGKKKMYRTASDPSDMYVNVKFPFIAANIDRWFKHDKNKAILEIKTGTERLWYKYEDMLPQYYLVQTLIYMFVMECYYAEIAVLMDNSDFHVFPITMGEDEVAIVENLLHRADDFYSRVQEVQEYAAETSNQEDIIAFAAQREPEIIGAPDAYKEFLKERYRYDYKTTTIEGNDELMKIFLDYKLYQRKISEAEKMKTEKMDICIRQFVDNQCGTIDFGEFGKATYDNEIGLRISPKILLAA